MARLASAQLRAAFCLSFAFAAVLAVFPQTSLAADYRWVLQGTQNRAIKAYTYCVNSTKTTSLTCGSTNAGAELLDLGTQYIENYLNPSAGVYQGRNTVFSSDYRVATVKYNSCMGSWSPVRTVKVYKCQAAPAPGPAVSLSLSGVPTSSAAGIAFNVTVQALSSSGAVATGYSGPITLNSTDSQAVLGTGTLTAGVGTASVTLKTAGSQTVGATSGTLSSPQVSVTVTPTAAVTLRVTPSASSVSAGTANLVTVMALDAFGNRATSANAGLTFSSSDTRATLPSSATLTAGLGAYPFTLISSGSQSISARFTSNSAIAGTENVQVKALQAIGIYLSGVPSTATACENFPVTLTAKDTYGNTADTYNGTVTFQANDTAAVLPPPSPLVNGTGTFPIRFGTTFATAFITYRDNASGMGGSSEYINIQSGPVKTLQLMLPTTPVRTGIPYSFAVYALDGCGNLSQGYNGLIHFTTSDPSAYVPDVQITSGGQAGGAITFGTYGTHSVFGSDVQNASLFGQGTVTVQAPPPSSCYNYDPYSYTCGQPYYDEFGNFCGTGMGPGQATQDPATVACGYPIFDSCGNYVGEGTGGCGGSACPNPATIPCGYPVFDPFGNYCGEGTAGCGGGFNWGF